MSEKICRWRKLSEHKPNRGQRCIIWETSLNQSTFAYWDGECFYSVVLGALTVFGSFDAKWWMPEPESPYRGEAT